MSAIMRNEEGRSVVFVVNKVDTLSAHHNVSVSVDLNPSVVRPGRGNGR